MTKPDRAGILDLDALTVGDPSDAVTPEQKADDVACRILYMSMDAAQNIVGHGPEVRDQSLALASIHSHIAATVYAAHAHAEALRDAVAELAGAISEVGTDIGSGLTEGLHDLKASPRP